AFALGVALDTHVERRGHGYDAELHPHLPGELLPLLAGLADAIRVVDDHVLAALEKHASTLHLPVADGILKVLAPRHVVPKQGADGIAVQACNIAPPAVDPLLGDYGLAAAAHTNHDNQLGGVLPSARVVEPLLRVVGHHSPRKNQNPLGSCS